MHRDVCGEESGGKMSPQTSAPQPSPLSSPSSIGVNLRVTGHCSQGGRKYMEDFFSVAYHQSENAKDLEYAFVGIYDGHGGSEAATFAKEHLMMEIINQKLFWSDSDQDVLRAIREGYIATHYAMWREQEKWPKTATGLPSTAGTTATVAFIRHEKIYIGHVGDSGIVLGYQNADENFWRAKQLTEDHKPESHEEKTRIVNSGGKVIVKSGVPRVVWNRPRTGHKGPVRRSTPIDEIPFLAVARSLGDLWSYNSALNEFVVSPDPDVKVIKINPKTFRCLIFGTDGLWNVVSPGDAVDTVHEKEVMNERISRLRGENNTWCNPSKGLVEKALKTWSAKKMRADNTSVVTVILYPPGGSSDSESSVNDCTSCYGLEYMQMTSDIHPNDYVHMSPHGSQQKFQSSAINVPDPLYETSSYNQSHQLPHYDTIATSPAMRLHLQQQQQHQHQEGYMASYMDRDDSIYTNNYETHCDTNRYLYYEDQESNTYMNSFAESYNSLLTSSLEREDSSRSNDSSSDNSNESVNSNPSDYHSYNSLNHTGLAGHDRVQHHCPNNEYHMEQQLYQEQCMSAEEGYSLTKLETRVEQKLRGNTSTDCRLNSVQTFQIFGGETSSTNEYNQYNSISSSYKNSCHTSDNSNSNFLNSYEDNARCYEPNMSAVSCKEAPESNETTTNLCIERLDEKLEMERLSTEVAAERTTDTNEPSHITLPPVEEDMDVTKDKDDVEIPADSIQIHEISSSIAEESTLPLQEKQQTPIKEESQKRHIIQPSLSCESVIDSTPLKKAVIPKLVLYPNVPNENHRTSRGSSVQQYPRTFEKRMLRSMTVDYSKRTLRSRNSLSKEMKAKSTTSTNLRRSTIVQNKFIKAIQSPGNSENTSVISRKSLNLRSRQITTTTTIWSDSPVSSSTSSQRQRKSKPVSFCDKSTASKVSDKPVRNVNGASSSGLLVTPAARSRVTVGANSPFSNHHLQQQIAMSFAKRTNLRNSGWGSGKTTMQTRNRVQKRLGR